MIGPQHIAIVASILVALSFPQTCHAYIDPGTGSYLIQLLIAGFLGALFSVKLYWRSIKGFVVSRFHERKGEAGPQ